jgi:dihydroorotate dehydrogenase (fumarate)
MLSSTKMKLLEISPPLLNSSNPWCTTLEQLSELYDSPYTGAVTTRTSLLNGYPNDPSSHQFTFFNPQGFSTSEANKDKAGTDDQTGSLNTLGYSPRPLREYIQFIKTISDGLKESEAGKRYKPFIISVTGDVKEVVECYGMITKLQSHVQMNLAMEINLSCPNIVGKPPPAYSSEALLSYLIALKEDIGEQHDPFAQQGQQSYVPIGIKTPPYTYHDQYQAMIDALLKSAKAEPTVLPCPVAFITATNTLGSSLLLSPTTQGAQQHATFERTLESANKSGIGGLAGTPLHPLALGNVFTIKEFLSQHHQLESIEIIGVGGVEDVQGYNRMRSVGASAVGVGTALGRRGIQVFEEIGRELARSR